MEQQLAAGLRERQVAEFVQQAWKIEYIRALLHKTKSVVNRIGPPRGTGMTSIHACVGAAVAVACGSLTPVTAASAAKVFQQQGEKDPTKNGFGAVTCCGSGATGVGKKDLGLPVWAMGGGDTGDQFAYARALTTVQATTVAKRGFVITVVERASLGSGPAYTADVPVTVGSALLDNGAVRWEIDIGVNAAGDPVVVLPSVIDNSGPGSSVESHGASYVLTGAGSNYNKYQLAVIKGKGSLFVNGNQVLTGYTGETNFVSDSGVVFAVDSGGQANFNLVGLTSTAKLP